MSFQVPEEVPHPQDETLVSFHSPLDIVLFLVLPLLMIVAFFLWRRFR